MQTNPNTRKKIIVGIVAGAVVLAAAGGYYYTQKIKPKADADHSSHQAAPAATGTSAVTGDKVTLDAKARQLAGVQTAPVQKKQLVKDIRATGKVTLNESRRSFLTSRVEGRVDELYITAEGAYIAPGQAIASVYSPTYIAAQEEYILAYDGVRKLQGAGESVTQMNNRLLEAARRKLLLLGVPAGDIEHLEHVRKANTHMTVYAQFGGIVMEKQVLPGAYIMPGDKLYNLADLGSVWLNADLFEKDIAAVQLGQTVRVTTTAYPGEEFSGQVVFINPVLDDATRTVKVRVELPNSDGKLKPNMFAMAAVQVALGDSLAIPTSSLIDTGNRKIVFVAQDESTFVKRDITIGQESSGFIQVLSGLAAGDLVVTQSAFLIDSQTQLGAYGSHAGHGSGKSGGSAPLQQSAPQQSAPQKTPQPPAQPARPVSPPAQGGHSGH